MDYEEIDKELTRKRHFSHYDVGKLIKYEAQKNYLNREIGDFVTKNKFYQGFWRPEVQKEIINIILLNKIGIMFLVEVDSQELNEESDFRIENFRTIIQKKEKNNDQTRIITITMIPLCNHQPR